VYSSLQLAQKYIKYYLQAYNGKGHGMHSPFGFDFILHVLNNKSQYHPPASIETLRQKLFQDNRVLEVEDLGAGSRVNASKQIAVRDIANAALKSKKYAQLMYRLVRHYQPRTIIELGTSLGLTTSYLATANPGARIISIEGSEAIANIARENFQSLGLQNIESLQGNFDSVLPTVLQSTRSVDMAYIDGNHRYGPTIAYFHHLLPSIHEYSVLVFDDIHWSAEMEQAWEEIKQHPAVRYSIDIFFLGFVFFRKEFKVKQQFCIRF
jgi:predicted O-methyltransferase YrrM